MSMMGDALDDLYATLHREDVAGEWVTLWVDEDSSAPVLAVLERAMAVPPNLQGLQPGQFDLANPSAKNIDHDFSIMAADYVVAGTLLTPDRGHRIKRTFNGTTQIYELMASSSNGAIWEWQDGYDK